MARDYEDLHDIGDLSDDELKELVRAHLADNNSVDAANVNVTVRDGRVSLSGRVGTETERRVAERVVTDVLGITEVENRLAVDPSRRAFSPEAIDDHLAESAESEHLLLGDRPLPLEPTTELNNRDVDDEVHTFGTTDVQKTISHGTPWIPPESPTQEGFSGTQADPEDYGEDH